MTTEILGSKRTRARRLILVAAAIGMLVLPTLAVAAAPIAGDDSATVKQNESAFIYVLDNDTDPDFDSLEVTGNTDPPNGTVTCTMFGDCEYTPDTNYLGPDSFDYTVSDGTDTDTGTVSISVVQNSAPVAEDDEASTEAGEPVDIFPLGNDTDADNDSLSVAANTDPTNGSASCDGFGCVYTPNSGFVGTDSFDYTASDGAATDTATITVAVTPGAVDDVVVTPKNTVATFNVLANDAGTAGSTVSILDPAAQGVATCEADGDCTYTPAAGFTGGDHFTYEVAFGTGSSVATVWLRVTAPAAPGPGGPVVLAGIDAEDGGVGGHGPISVYIDLTNTILANVENGGSGILVIGGKQAGCSPDEFWRAVGAGTGQAVTFVDETEIPGQSFAGFAMIAVVSSSFQTSCGLTDAENDALAARQTDIEAFVNVGGGLFGSSQDALNAPYGYLAALGSFTFATGLSYSDITPTPGGSAAGITDELDVCCWHDEYTAFPPWMSVLATNPLSGNAAAIGGLSVVVNNQPPTAADGTATTPVNTPVTITLVGSDPESAPLTYTIVTQPLNGAVVGSGPDVVYTPSLGYSGPDSFTFKVNDGQLDSNTATVSITVQSAANRPPDAVNDATTTPQGTPGTLSVLANDTDPDGDTLTVTGKTDGANGSVSCTAAGSCTYTPAAGFSGSDSFTYTISDGRGGTDTATVNVTVTPTIKATSTTYTGVASVQYSDAAALSGTLRDTSVTPAVGIAGKQLGFTLGTQNATAGPTDDSGSASTSLVVTQQPGSVATVATAFVGDAAYAASNDSDAFAVLKEDCNLTYAGPLSVPPLAMTTLAADLGEPDSSLGDRSAKMVTFSVTGTADSTLRSYTATTDANGRASTSVALPADVYSVIATFAGDDFYLGCGTSADVLVTMTEAAAKVTGGGWISIAVGRTSFGFNAIPQADGSWKGQLQIRMRGGKDRYHAKSVSSLTATGSSATWSGTGSWNGTPGYLYSVSVVDQGSSGSKKGDTIAITITAPGGGIEFTTGGAQALKGGNITVQQR